MSSLVKRKNILINLLFALAITLGAGCVPVNNNTDDFLHLGWVWSGSSSPLLNDLDIDANGIIYVTDEGGTLYAINPRGKTIWKYRGDYETASPPVVGSDGTIYIIGVQKAEQILYGNKFKKEKLYAIDSDGREKWKLRPERPFLTMPLAAPDGSIYIEMRQEEFQNSYVYHITADGKGTLFIVPEVDLFVSDFDSKQGLLMWSSRADRFIVLSNNEEVIDRCEETYIPRSDLINAPGNSIVYSRSKRQFSQLELIFLDSNCNIVWNNTTTDEQITDYYPIALGNNGTVFFSSEDGVVQGFATEDGRLLWEKDFTSGTENIIYLLTGADGINYFLSTSATIGVFDNNGNLIWSQQLYEAGHPSFPRVDSSGGLTLVQNGKLLSYTSNKLLTHREPSPKSAPQSRSDAEEEILSFILDYIVVHEIGGTADYILNSDQLWVEAPPEGNIIIYAPMEVGDSFADIEHPIKVWLYSNGKLLDADKDEIEKFHVKYMDNPSSGLWAYGRHEFGILDISEDFMSAKIYIGVICGPRCGHGVNYWLKRSPSGEWWIIESQRTWIS